MIPPSTARSSIQGRPPLGCGGLGGSSGWIAAQTSSGTSCSAMVGVVMAAHHPRPSSRLCNDLLAVIGIWPTGGYQDPAQRRSAQSPNVTPRGATAAPDPPIWAAD